MSGHRPFFIVGASRSGTTMFRLMVNIHSRLSVPGESWFLSDLMDALPSEGPLTSDQAELALGIIEGHWRWREWGLDAEDLRTVLRSLQKPDLADLIHATYSMTLPDAPKVRWGDKTPGYATEIERLHRVFPNAQFLHIIRDGRDVCLSLKKTRWHGEATWTIADYWGSTVMAACRAGRALPPGLYKEVAYEDLVLDTRTVLESVCEFLGVDWEVAMLDFHTTAKDNVPDRADGHLSKTRRRPRRSDVSRWGREQRRRQTVIFEAFAGSALELAGYRRSARHGLGLVRLGCRVLEWLATSSLPFRRKLGLHFPGLKKSL